MRVIWKEKKIPEDWKMGIIVPIFKKGNKQKCENYRGITLLCHTQKIYEKILLQNIRPVLEETGREEQFGFRKGCYFCDETSVRKEVGIRKRYNGSFYRPTEGI
uniref:Uncharacterized protein n=2 Tax=Homalodisca liturata TaxID=320908 RepID=A0A1B6JZB3_9HEMI